MKKEKIKKISNEEQTPILNTTQQGLIKSAEKLLPTFDKDLAQFTACSAVSLNSDKFYNIVSMCYLLQINRQNKKDGKVLTTTELSNEDYLFVGAVSSLLGSKVIDN